MKKIVSYILILVIFLGIIPMSFADGEVLDKVLLETYPSAQYGVGQNTGPIMGQVASEFQVKSNSSVSVTDSYFTDSSGNRFTGEMQDQTYTLHVSVVANGDTLIAKGAYVSINNSKQGNIYVEDDLQHAAITWSVKPSPVSPIIYWNPTNEVHTEGDGNPFSFSATCANFDTYQWYLVDKDGKKIKPENVGTIANGMYSIVSDIENGSRFNIYSATDAIDGYYAICYFTNGAGTIGTSKAYCTVKSNGQKKVAEPTATPASEEEGEVEATPTPTPTEEPTSTPTPTETIAVVAPTLDVESQETQKNSDKEEAIKLVKIIAIAIGGVVIISLISLRIQYKQEKKRKRKANSYRRNNRRY